jgi:F-type H+-transporting ATPase subunit b
MKELLQDATFWFGVSFAIFIVIAWVTGRKPVAQALDNYTAKVKAELDEAAALRQEAARILAETESKHASALKEAQNILAHAQEQAKALQEQAEKDLQSTLKRREAQAADRIRMIEEQTREELRTRTVELALQVAEQVLRERLTPEQDKAIVEKQIHGMAENLKKVA